MKGHRLVIGALLGGILASGCSFLLHKAWPVLGSGIIPALNSSGFSNYWIFAEKDGQKFMISIDLPKRDLHVYPLEIKASGAKKVRGL